MCECKEGDQRVASTRTFMNRGTQKSHLFPRKTTLTQKKGPRCFFDQAKSIHVSEHG